MLVNESGLCAVSFSLRILTENFKTRNNLQPQRISVGTSKELNLWSYDSELVLGIWGLLKVCSGSDVKEIKSLVAGFISRVCFPEDNANVCHKVFF